MLLIRILSLSIIIDLIHSKEVNGEEMQGDRRIKGRG